MIVNSKMSLCRSSKDCTKEVSALSNREESNLHSFQVGRMVILLIYKKRINREPFFKRRMISLTVFAL